MAGKLKKPKLKKLPKKPKATAKLEAWKNWEKKAKAIQSENRKKDAVYKAGLKAKESVKKTIAKIAAIGKV